MSRSFFRRMRALLPPTWVIVTAIFLYLVYLALYGWVVWWLGLPGEGERFLRMRDAAVGFICVVYGVYRVGAFHPLFQSAYRQWLELTPWTSRKPLPLGPIHLVAQDIVVLALLLLLLHGSPLRFALVPAAFLGSYLVALGYSLLVTDVWKVGYALAFGLGLVVVLAHWPIASLCLLAGLYPLAYLGLRRSLDRFPWKTPPWFETSFAGVKSGRTGSARLKLGWPYDHLRFNLPDRRIPRQHAILLSLLAGWYVYAVASVIPDPEGRDSIPGLVLMLGSLGCIFGRFITYCGIHWPPISLWGRIRTFRWIIPGYDRVLVAPLCALVVAVAAPVSRFSLKLPPEIVFPVAWSLVLLITLNLGPTLKRWQLTGYHRIAQGPTSRADFHQL